MLAEKFPLQWPQGYPRTKNRNHSRFGRVSFAVAREMYRSLVKKCHPDSGGSDEEFQKLYNAYKEAKKYFGVI